jgi:GNAT superfamily N-acetyltransferase
MSIEITNFDGNIEGVAEMAKESWRLEYGRGAYPNLYRKELLEYYLTGTDPKHHTAAYDGKRLVGFLAGFIHTYNLKGRICRGAVSGLLFTHRDYMRQGVAMQVIEKAVEINRQGKYIDFSLNYLDRGHKSTYLINKFSRTYTIQCVKEFSAIVRVIDLPKIKHNEGLKWYESLGLKMLGAHGVPSMGQMKGTVRPYRREDAGACAQLLNTYQKTVPLSRVWQIEELDRQFNCPPVSHAVVYEDQGRVKGVINYTMVEHVGQTTAYYAWLNHVHYAELSRSEQIFFVASFLKDAAQKGCASVLEWNKNYYDKKALWRCRFIPYPRILRLVSWIFNPEISMANLDSFYEQHL